MQFFVIKMWNKSSLLIIRQLAEINFFEWSGIEQPNPIRWSSLIATEFGVFYVKFIFWFRCGHCKQLTPEYAAAAKRLNDVELKVPLAKVNCTSNAPFSSSKWTMECHRWWCGRLGFTDWTWLKTGGVHRCPLWAPQIPAAFGARPGARVRERGAHSGLLWTPSSLKVYSLIFFVQVCRKESLAASPPPTPFVRLGRNHQIKTTLN